MRNHLRLALLTAFAAVAACGGGGTEPSDPVVSGLTISSGNNQVATVGTALAVAPAVLVKDQSGNGIPGITVTFAVTGGGGSVTGATATTDAGGIARVGSWTLGTQAGANLLSATAGSFGVVFGATGTAGAPASFVFTTAPGTTAQSGVALAPQPVLQLHDQYGNTSNQAGVPITVALASGGGTLGGTLTVNTNGLGAATFTNLSLAGTVGPRTLNFTAPGLPPLASGAIALTAGVPTQQVLSTPPSSTAVNGVVLAQVPVIQLLDAAGNPVSQAGIVITVFTSGGALLGTTAVATNASGQAIFTGLALTGPAGNYLLSFAANGIADLNSGTIALSAGAPTGFRFTATPSTTTVNGAVLGQQPTLQLQDAGGNAVAQAGVSVTAGISPAGPTVGGTATVVTDGAGLATFTNLSLTGAVGTYQLRFSSTGLTTLSSANLALSAGAATTLALSVGDAQSATVGTAVPIDPAVRITDQSGNPVSGVAVTFAPASGGGSVTGGTATSNASGIAAVGSWTLGTAVGSNTLTATSAGLTGSPLTFTAMATAAAASQLALTTQPSAAASNGVSLAQQPVVQLRDAFGNNVAQAGVVVTVTPSVGGTLLGTTTATTSAGGVATFSGLILNGTPANYTLAFTASGLTGATSTTIALSAGAPTQLVMSTQPSSTVQNGAALAQQPAVRLRDAGGNNVSQAGVNITVSLAGSPAGVTLGGTATVATNASGIATYSGLSLTGLVGSYTLTFSGSGLSSAASGTVAVTAGAATTLALSAGDGQSATVGAAVAVDPAVLVTDQSGNPVSGVGVTFAVASGGGSVVGGAATTNAAGLATVTSWTLGTSAGSNTLTATSLGLTGSPLTFTATATAAAASKLAITTQPSATANNGAALGQQPVLQLQDAFSNPVAQAGVNVTVTASAGGALVGTTTVATNGGGQASFSGLILNGLAGSYTLGFISSGLTGATSTSIALGAGAATAVVLTTQPSSSVVNGSVLAQQPVLRLRDAAGNNVSQAGVNVTSALTGSPAGVSLGGTATVATDASGIATFAGLSLTGLVGSYTLSFTSTALTGATSGSISLTVGAATTLALSAGDAQSATVGTAVPIDPAVLITDQSGNPVSGVAVTFAPASGGGNVTGGAATSSASGIATVGSWTLGTAVGGNTLTATSAGLTGSPLTFTATATAAAASQVVLGTPPSSSASSGAVLAQQPVLQLQDAFGNSVAQAGVIVTAAITGAPAGVVLGGTPTATTSAGGTATFTGLSLTGTAGTYTLSFTASGLTGTTSGSIVLGAGAASKLVLTTQPSSSVANGSALAQQPVIRLRDASNNNVSQAGVNVTVSLTGSPAGVTLGGTATVATNGSGVASFSGLSLTGLVGSYTLSFASAPLTGVTSNSVGLTAGAATTLALSAGDGQSATVGAAVAVDPAVLVTDQSGNPVSGVGVTFAVASGGGSVVGGAATTNAAGLATVTSWTLGTAAGSNTLTATSLGLTGSPLTFTATATAAAASKLAITTQPSATANNGAALGQQPVLQLQDAFSNPVAQVGVNVTVTASAGGALVGTTTVATNGGGQASFSGLILNGLAGSYTLGFSSGGLTGATSTSIALGAGAATAVVLTTQPSSSVVNGSVLVQQPVLRLRDAAGNNVSQAGVNVTAALTGSPVGVALGGTATVATNASGIATFGGLSLTGLVGSYTLSFTSTGLTGATSSSIALAAGIATAVAISAGDGQSATVGAAVATRPAVLVSDQSGNPVSGVTITFAVTGGGGSLTAFTPASNAAGIATVGSWTLGTTAGANSITASGAGLAGSPLTFTATGTPAAASQLTISTQPSTTATNGVALVQQPVIQLQDAFGNAVSQSGVVVTAAVTGATLGGPPTATTNGSGTATFSGLSLTGTVGSYTLGFSATGLTGATSGSIALAAGAATKVVLTTQPSATVTNGSTLAQQPVVRLRDAGNNNVSQAGVNVTVALTGAPAGVVLGGTTTIATSGVGVVSFTNLSLTGLAGGYTLSVSSSGLTGATSNGITLQAGPATSVSALSALSQSGHVAAGVGAPPSVKVVDQSGNPVSGVGVTFAVTAGGGTLSGASTATDALGVATVGGWVLGRSVTTNTVTATAGALPVVSFDATASFVVSAVTAGNSHTCVTTVDGVAYCWGDNSLGGLGDSTTNTSLFPVAVATSQTFASLAAGRGYTCAVTGASVGWCWGANLAGQLGLGNKVSNTAPAPISGGLSFSRIDASVAADSIQTCARLTAGTLECWGNNHYAQFGKGTTSSSSLPTAAAGGGQFIQVSAGVFYTCGVRATGAGACWGLNGFGQLGDSTLTQRTNPATVKGGHLFSQIVTGTVHSCGLTTSQTVFCWGFNLSGRLGQDTVSALPGNQSLVPIQVSGLSSIVELAEGNGHTCARTSGGQLFCWGLNDSGQLGDGTLTNRVSPTLVPLPSGVTSFSALAVGETHTCAVANTGAAYCWGEGGSGELGDGNGVDSPNPVLVRDP